MGAELAYPVILTPAEADALPGCATPRRLKIRDFHGSLGRVAGGGQCHKATGNDKAGPESPEIIPKFVLGLFANPASEPKADLALGIVTIFLRTHRVVHRRISMGYGGSADSGRVA